MPAFLYDEQIIWLVVLAFYLFDQFKLLGSDELLVQQTFMLRWSFVLASVPVVVRDRHLYVLNPLAPHALAFRLRWLLSDPTNAEALGRTDGALTSLQRRIAPLRVIGATAFVVFFVLCPIATELYGLAQALFRVALPAYTAFVVLLAVHLALSRRAFGLAAKDIVAIVLECAVCPGYLPNVVRKLSWRLALPADGAVFALRHLAGPSKERFLAAMDQLISADADELPTDEARSKLRAYRDEIQS